MSGERQQGRGDEEKRGSVSKVKVGNRRRRSRTTRKSPLLNRRASQRVRERAREIEIETKRDRDKERSKETQKLKRERKRET